MPKGPEHKRLTNDKNGAKLATKRCKGRFFASESQPPHGWGKHPRNRGAAHSPRAGPPKGPSKADSAGSSGSSMTGMPQGWASAGLEAPHIGRPSSQHPAFAWESREGFYTSKWRLNSLKPKESGLFCPRLGPRRCSPMNAPKRQHQGPILHLDIVLGSDGIHHPWWLSANFNASILLRNTWPWVQILYPQ